MAYTEVTYTPDHLFAGEIDVVSVPGTVPASTVIPALAPVKRGSGGTIVPATELTDKIIGVLVPKTDGSGIASSSDPQSASFFKSGEFWADKIDFSLIEDATTDALKQALFDGTGITIRFG
jgi:hypothetical protein